jgi:hypothetical protein
MMAENAPKGQGYNMLSQKVSLSFSSFCGRKTKGASGMLLVNSAPFWLGVPQL